MLYDLESHANDGRCGLSRNEDIRRYVGKLVEKQTLVKTISIMSHITHLRRHQMTSSVSKRKDMIKR